MRKRNYFRKTILGVIVFVLVFALGTMNVTADTAKFGVGEEKMVAAAHPLAVEAGYEMLEKGGNAIDAAVATGFALGVVEPFGSGMGGEGVMMIYIEEEEKVLAIDFKGVAPSQVPKPENYDKDTVTDDEHWRMGVGAQLVPGTPAGLAYALENYGTMELKEVLQPAIRYAEEGFEVYPLLADLIVDRQKYMNDAARDVFFPDGEAAETGDILYQKDLANTMKRIAENGINEFYKGETADKIADALEGHFVKEDLENYEPIVKEPATGNYRGYKLYSSPPPVAGAVLIHALNILENFNLENLYNNDEVYYNHVFMEAFNIAVSEYYDCIIDPAYGNPPIEEITDEIYGIERSFLIGPEAKDGYYLSGLGLKSEDIIDWDVIEKKRASVDSDFSFDFAFETSEDYLTDENVLSESTSHYVVADGEGNMVSTTQTLSHFMGSRFVVPETGILMNNGLGLFRNDPNDIGRIDPGKRARSMLVPTIITKDGEPFMALGSPGATRIMPAVAQVIINVIDHNMSLKQAIEHPRMHYYGQIEDPSEETVIRLNKLMHVIESREYPDNYFGGVQALLFEGPFIYGGADPRRAGTVKGDR